MLFHIRIFPSWLNHSLCNEFKMKYIYNINRIRLIWTFVYFVSIILTENFELFHFKWQNVCIWNAPHFQKLFIHWRIKRKNERISKGKKIRQERHRERERKRGEEKLWQITKNGEESSFPFSSINLCVGTRRIN